MDDVPTQTEYPLSECTRLLGWLVEWPIISRPLRDFWSLPRQAELAFLSAFTCRSSQGINTAWRVSDFSDQTRIAVVRTDCSYSKFVCRYWFLRSGVLKQTSRRPSKARTTGVFFSSVFAVVSLLHWICCEEKPPIKLLGQLPQQHLI